LGYSSRLQLILNNQCNYRLLYGTHGIYVKLDTGQSP